jgi:hypothetical protein
MPAPADPDHLPNSNFSITAQYENAFSEQH